MSRGLSLLEEEQILSQLLEEQVITPKQEISLLKLELCKTT